MILQVLESTVNWLEFYFIFFIYEQHITLQK